MMLVRIHANPLQVTVWTRFFSIFETGLAIAQQADAAGNGDEGYLQHNVMLEMCDHGEETK